MGRRAVALLFFLLLLFLVHRMLHTVFGPDDYIPSITASHDYDPSLMQEALRPERVAQIHADILAHGSRYMGGEGATATANMIREAYERAGLEILEQDNLTVAPVTQFREIYLVDSNKDEDGYGQRLNNIEIYPFLPNHLQPVTTPDEGITGTLLRLTDEVIATRSSFEDCIGLIEATDEAVPQTLQYDWSRYAQLGVKALIVAHPDGMASIPWDRVANQMGGMVSSIPVNFVRLAATEEIFAHEGRTVRLRVRVRFEQVPNKTIIGILRAKGGAATRESSDALVLLTNYDAMSILPDLAPGTMQAIPVATHLALVEGLSAYRDSLVRDVVFVSFGAQFMARDGDNNILKLLEENFLRAERDPIRDLFRTGPRQVATDDNDAASDRDAQDMARLRKWELERNTNADILREVTALKELFTDARFLSDPAFTQQQFDILEAGSQKFLTEQVSHVLNTIVFELHEPMLQARLAFLRTGGEDTDSQTFNRYLAAKRAYDIAVMAAGQRPLSLLSSPDFGDEFAREHQLRQRVHDRLEHLARHHEFRERHLSQCVTILRTFIAYQKLIVFDNKMVPAAGEETRRESLSFWDGEWGIKTNMREMGSLVASARQRLASTDPTFGDRSIFEVPELSRWHSSDVSRHTIPVLHLSATEWTLFGYHMYTFMSFGRAQSYRHTFDPVERPFMRDVESMRHSIATFGELLLSVAHGNGRFAPIQLGWLKKTFGGRVLASGLGQSIVPRYPIEGAVLASRSYFGFEYSYPGFYQHPLLMTDPYGRYELVNTPSDFWVNNFIWAFGFSPVAALHGPDGMIAWMKDEGETGQRLYKSVNLAWFEPRIEDVTLVLFRASPLAYLDVTNPQRMTDFSGIRLFESRGLSALERFCHFRIQPDLGIGVSYVEPDESVYVGFEAGSSENDLAKLLRAFMLNVPRDWKEMLRQAEPGREIVGPGYTGDDAGILRDTPLHMARSLASVNHRRLTLQQQHHMADEQTEDYHEKALGFLERAENPLIPKTESIRAARDSATYSMLNHPVLRSSLTEAVIGILYYLALLVPFVFFFEKLVFCHTDIRRQLASQVIIFLVVFVALNQLHPAFAIIRSSLMILLGFAVILIAGSMTLLFSEKFKENLEELSKHRGRVAAAEVNRVGVIGSAFMLGLNNMHRRKMRTWLTCGTLSLMTFAMISFTSVRTDIVNEEIAIGRAPYQGVLLKKDLFQRFTDAEVFAIRSKYEHIFDVSPRKMSLGTQNWIDKRGNNPELEIIHDRDGHLRSQRFHSLIQMTHTDPLQTQLRVIAGHKWFTAEQVKGVAGVPPPIMIPDRMAENIGLRIEDVASAPVPVQVNGRTFEVIAVFEAESLAAIRDMDNRDILPYDIENMARIHVMEGGEVIADESAPRLPTDRIAIAPLRDLGIQIPNEKDASNVSIALSLLHADPRSAREEIDVILEQTERPAYYGIGGMAYRGQRTRKAGISGLIDLAIPLLIVALTVLNTMKGSVHERRSEIAVYNAVGIAPKYVFFMFMAEAMVYVVVGSLCGYLLSQGIGRLLIALDMTGGMNMTFTSLTTIYASMAVGATVLISTWFPARTAMEIAQPAEEAGWKIPEPQDSTITFDLPFTFNWRDRMAVLVFCQRFLDDHGEGGSGSFYCLLPKPILGQNENGDDAPGVETTVWLKPYDLGVSQRATITIPRDPDTGEFKAWMQLEILSGSRDAWVRLNHRYVAEMRRHFLHWRAVSEEDRQAMFEEAREQFTSAMEARS